MGKRSEEWIGREFVSKTGKRCVVIEYNGCKDVVLQFEDGTIIHRVANSLKSCPPCHPDDNPTLPSMFIGDRFKSNRFGEVEVIKYEGKKYVTIRFLEYNNEESVAQAVNIRRGLVSPDSLTVKTLARWKEVATNNHNNSYDYSHLSEKPRSGDRVDVRCRDCDSIISVDSEDHLFGRGHCSCKKEKEIDLFYLDISSKSQYKIQRRSVLTKEMSQIVEATCAEHGNFSMSIKALTNNGKCPTCELVDRRMELLRNKESILTNVEVLGFTENYDYILLDTRSGDIKVYKPSYLVKKENSPFEFKAPAQRVTFDVFLQRAKRVHGDTYEYSNYKSIGEKLTVTHKACGNTYEQLASGHINGNYGKGVGCPHCAKYGLSLSRPTNLYILVADNGYVKVGITHQTTEGRIRQIHKSSRPICLFKCFSSWNMSGADAIFVEKELLSKLKEYYKQPPEVFDGSTETFVGANPEDVCGIIKKLIFDMNIQLFC